MRERKSFFRAAAALSLPAVAIIMLLWFCAALGNLDKGQGEKGRQQLEDALRRGAVACYAAEGVYPPSAEYLAQHYGVRIDEENYSVFYEIFADNIMPQITVLEK